MKLENTQHGGLELYLIPEVAERCGLEEKTVMDLLLAGWAYKEKIDGVPTWVHPLTTLQEKK